eukprot:EC725852.1.p1 GENE.EC725852.1~~EC725852.1.p1  ORF type:complete len:167 (+),score=37.72 EC725852.1:51-503(+)
MAQPQSVDVSQLPVEELKSLQQQFDEELNFLVRSFEQLASFHAKFNETHGSLESLKTATEGREIMVPLTSSLYVGGKLADVKNVLVDVGTGYFVERTPAQAQEYVKRRVENLRNKMDMIQQTAGQKKRNLDIINQVLRAKMAAAQQAGAS